MAARPRARDLGIRIGSLEPGPSNAITDVAGVGVGHATLISGDGTLAVGSGPVRTGVTVIQPHDGNVWEEPVFCAPHRLNGNGEMTGLEWVRESGLLTSPIAITNTHSVGVVRDALIEWELGQRGATQIAWALPVVAETWDGRLNDINGFHVGSEHVFEALAAVSRGPVEEGSVGGGTGMIAFGFKGGIGTSSRLVPPSRAKSDGPGYTVGVLVQANFGRRARFAVGGVPVGRVLTPDAIPLPADSAVAAPPQGAGSVIVIVATDAPLLPHQCARLAQRVTIGIGRLGGAGENSSGDLFLCFATGNRGLAAPDPLGRSPRTQRVDMLGGDHVDGLFYAVIDAIEEAVLNAMLAADTMTGRDGVTAHALPHDELMRVLAEGWSPLS
jgi:D-aminopeptidase